MEFWEFLIQKDGDRSWLPIESPEAEILEGRYRVIARSSRVDAPVEIRVTHIDTDVDPPKRRVHKRSSQTNPDGLMVVIPFTMLKPGELELRCTSDIMADMSGDAWQHTLKLQVLSHQSESELLDFWESDSSSADASQLSSEETIDDQQPVLDTLTASAASPQTEDVPLPERGDESPDERLTAELSDIALEEPIELPDLNEPEAAIAPETVPLKSFEQTFEAALGIELLDEQPTTDDDRLDSLAEGQPEQAADAADFLADLDMDELMPEPSEPHETSDNRLDFVEPSTSSDIDFLAELGISDLDQPLNDLDADLGLDAIGPDDLSDDSLAEELDQLVLSSIDDISDDDKNQSENSIEAELQDIEGLTPVDELAEDQLPEESQDDHLTRNNLDNSSNEDAPSTSLEELSLGDISWDDLSLDDDLDALELALDQVGEEVSSQSIAGQPSNQLDVDSESNDPFNSDMASSLSSLPLDQMGEEMSKLFEMAEQMADQVVASMAESFDQLADPHQTTAESDDISDELAFHESANGSVQPSEQAIPLELDEPSEATPSDSVSGDLVPLLLSLDHDAYTLQRGQSLQLSGTIYAEDESAVPGSLDLMPVTFNIQLINPQNAEIIQEVRQPLEVRSLPYAFTCLVEMPADLHTHLLLGELELYASSPYQLELPILLASHGFTVTTALENLLEFVQQSAADQILAIATEPPQAPAKSPELPTFAENPPSAEQHESALKALREHAAAHESTSADSDELIETLDAAAAESMSFDQPMPAAEDSQDDWPEGDDAFPFGIDDLNQVSGVATESADQAVNWDVDSTANFVTDDPFAMPPADVATDSASTDHVADSYTEEFFQRDQTFGLAESELPARPSEPDLFSDAYETEPSESESNDRSDADADYFGQPTDGGYAQDDYGHGGYDPDDYPASESGYGEYDPGEFDNDVNRLTADFPEIEATDQDDTFGDAMREEDETDFFADESLVDSFSQAPYAEPYAEPFVEPAIAQYDDLEPTSFYADEEPEVNPSEPTSSAPVSEDWMDWISDGPYCLLPDAQGTSYSSSDWAKQIGLSRRGYSLPSEPQESPETPPFDPDEPNPADADAEITSDFFDALDHLSDEDESDTPVQNDALAAELYADDHLPEIDDTDVDDGAIISQSDAAIHSFDDLGLNDRFLSRLSSLASNEDWISDRPYDEVSDSSAAASANPESEIDSNQWEIVVDDEDSARWDTQWTQSSFVSSDAAPIKRPIVEDGVLVPEELPVPELVVPEGELIAGQLISITVKLVETESRFYVKLWIHDCQTRSIVDGPRWLVDFMPAATGILEASTQLTVPFGCLEIRFEAIAVEMATQRESHKAIAVRHVVPPNLPSYSFDSLEPFDSLGDLD
jgi:hypothetical protein